MDSRKIENFNADSKHKVGKVTFEKPKQSDEIPSHENSQLYQFKEVLSPKSYYRNRFMMGRKYDAHIKQTWDGLFPSKGLWRKLSIDERISVSLFNYILENEYKKIFTIK